MKKTLFLLLIMFMFVGIVKAELQEVSNPDVTLTYTIMEEQVTKPNGMAELCWFTVEGACEREYAARMKITIQNDMDEPMETYKIYIPGTNVLVAPYDGHSIFNFFWHIIKYDDELGINYFDENYRDDIVQNQWVQTPTQTIPAHSTVEFGGDFWVFSDNKFSSATKNYYTYEEVEPTTNEGNEGTTTGDNNDLDNTHNIENNETGELLFTIKYDGGKGAKESMEDTPVYDGKKVTLPKNKFKNDKYIFAGWKVYLEDAEGKRTEVKVKGVQLILKDGDELPEIEVPAGHTLVLAAQWTTNPNTGEIITTAIIVLICLGIYFYFFEARKYKKIAQI